MDLKQVEYFSQAADGLSMDEVNRLATSSSARNHARDISGWLSYDRVCFFQCLEGEASVIDELFGKILADPRHRDIVTISNRPIARRNFKGWAMNFAAGINSPDTVVSINGGDPALAGGVGQDTSALLNLQDIVTLAGDNAGMPSMPIGQAVEAAGRRWQYRLYKTLVAQLSAKTFGTATEFAANLVDYLINANRRGPAVLPNLKAFLMRRTDLVYHEISKASKNLQVAVHGRGDVVDRFGTLELISAITAVTFTLRALADLDPNCLRKPKTKRMLINLCRSILEDADVESTVTGLKGAPGWIEALVG
jgi:hypothetical protein